MSLKKLVYLDGRKDRRMLDHLGLGPPQQKKTPPTREVVRVPVDDEGRAIQPG